MEVYDNSYGSYGAVFEKTHKVFCCGSELRATNRMYRCSVCGDTKTAQELRKDYNEKKTRAEVEMVAVKERGKEALKNVNLNQATKCAWCGGEGHVTTEEADGWNCECSDCGKTYWVER